MKVTIFNGSPRRKASNSKLLIDQFQEGMQSVAEPTISVHYLADIKKNDVHQQAFKDASLVLIIFPLYTDSMPGVVKYFFETIHTLPINARRKIGFIVQSGFPEAKHSVFVERYLEKFTRRLGCTYIGTVIKGGIEGIQDRSASMNRKLYSKFFHLGLYFANYQELEPKITKKLRNPYQLPRFALGIVRLLLWTGIMNKYWNKKLKEHQAYEKRFAQPFSIDEILNKENAL